MAKTPEGKVKEKLDEYLDSLGEDCWYFKPMTFGYGRSGIMDYIVCYKGFFLAPETKKKGGKSESWQEREQLAVNKAGGSAGRVTDVETVKNWVSEINRKYDCLGAAGML
jgi:hypothetical protein